MSQVPCWFYSTFPPSSLIEMVYATKLTHHIVSCTKFSHPSLELVSMNFSRKNHSTLDSIIQALLISYRLQNSIIRTIPLQYKHNLCGKNNNFENLLQDIFSQWSQKLAFTTHYPCSFLYKSELPCKFASPLFFVPLQLEDLFIHWVSLSHFAFSLFVHHILRFSLLLLQVFVYFSIFFLNIIFRNGFNN